MAYQRVPGSTTGVTPAQLLAEAQARPLEQPVNRLEALLLVDAARWVAWPQPAAGADELEARIAAQPPSDGDSAPGRLLRLDLAAREASAHGSLSQAADALNALPSGYSVKSLWLRWRETFGRHRRAALWDRTRSALAEAAAADGVPASETLAALLGTLDLPRWRAQTRLQADALSSEEDGRAAVARLLEQGARFDAVFAASDLIAIGALNAVRAHNLRVPEDISVVGFDGISLTAYSNPPLTTIDVPKRRMGRQAMRMLHGIITGQSTPGGYVLMESPLIIRASTALAPG